MILSRAKNRSQVSVNANTRRQANEGHHGPLIEWGEKEMSAIFLTTVGGAVHFAFLIQAYPSSPESVLARVLRENVQTGDVWNGPRIRTIDFSGMNALEVRAECAGIRAAVSRILSPLECAVVRARHGLTNYEDEDGERRFFFDGDRVQALQYLSTVLASPLYSDVPATVLDVLIARHYADKKTTPITLRQIAEAFGRSHTFYGKIASDLGQRLDKIEMRALDQLTPYFEMACHGVSLT